MVGIHEARHHHVMVEVDNPVGLAVAQILGRAHGLDDIVAHEDCGVGDLAAVVIESREMGNVPDEQR